MSFSYGPWQHEKMEHAPQTRADITTELPALGREAGDRRRAWILIGLFTAATVGGLLLGAGAILRLLFPAAALLVAVILFRSVPTLYVGFAWWLWFVTPGVRRIVDYQTAWDPQNPITLTPLLVSGITYFAILRHLPKFRFYSLFLFAVVITGVLFGYCVGIVRVGPMAATYAALTWLAPIGLGAYILLRWEQYPEHRATLQSVFLWGVIVLGAYGVLQFINPAEWDRYWMLNAEINTVGQPAPYKVRVFSLLNSQLPFATVMAAGLLLLFSMRAPWALAAAVVGATAFLLSLARSVWLSILIGVFIYAMYLTPRGLQRLALAALALGVAGSVGVTVASSLVDLDPMMRSVENRISTLTDLSGDISYKERRSFLIEITEEIASDPIGEGLGATGGAVSLRAGGEGLRDFDNGILNVVYSLGWFGGTLFYSGMIGLSLRALRRRESADDLFAKASRAVALSTAALAASGPIFSGVTAAVLWTFFGLTAAAHTWHSTMKRANGEPEAGDGLRKQYLHA